MPLNVAELQVTIGADVAGAERGLRSVEEGVKRVSGMGRLLDGISSAVRGVVQGFSQLGLAAMGVQSLTNALTGLTRSLFDTNASYEMVRAQLQAFTGSGEEAARIFAAIKDEAAKTPFAFNDMAKAAVMLIPSAKAAGKQLDELIKTAEVLAALNPEQGLVGAAFALREALSGDFISIVERFNLPRQYINQLKTEGVPAIEIVNRVLQEMGASTELVGLMASTARGRWSTFVDVLSQVKAAALEALFLQLSGTLSDITGWLSENQPRFEEFAGLVGQKLASAFITARDAVMTLIQALAGNWQDAPGQIREVHRAFGWLGLTIRAVVIPALQAGRTALNEFLSGFHGQGGDSLLARLGEGVRNTVTIIETNLPRAKEVLSSLVNTIKNDVVPAWDEFRTRIDPVVNAISTRLPTIVPVIAGVAAAFAGLSIAGAGLSAALGPLLGIMGALRAFASVTTILSTVVGILGGPVTAAILGVVAALGVGYLAWTQNWFGMRDTLTQFWTQAQPVIDGIKSGLVNAWNEATPILQSVADAFTRIWDAVAPLAGEALQSVISFGKEIVADWRAWAEEVGPLAAQAWDNVKNAVISVVTTIASVVGPVLSAIVSFVREHSDEIRTIIASVWGVIKSVIMLAINTIQNVLTIVLAIIAGDWRAAWEGMKRLVSEIWDGIKGIVTNVLNGLKAGLSIGLDALRDIASAAWDKLKELTHRAWDGLKEVISNTIEDIKAAVSTIKDKILSALSRAKDWLVETGRDLVQGLIDGIKSMAQRVIDTITGIVTGAIDSAKRLLGIKSPSRVFFAIGIDVGQGLVRGLARVRDAVSEAAAGVGEATVAGVTRELEQAQSAVNLLRDFASAVEHYLAIAERWSAVQRAGRRDWGMLFDLVEQLARGGIGAMMRVAREAGDEALQQASSALEATRSVIELVNALLDLSERLRRGLPRVTFEPMFDWLSTFASSAVTTLDTVARVLGTDALERARAVANTTKDVIELAASALDMALRWAETGAEARRVWDEAASWFNDVAKTVVHMFAALAQALGKDALEGADHVVQIVHGVVEAMSGALEAIAEFTNMTEQVQAVDSLIEWFVAFSDRVVRAMAGAATQLGVALDEARRAASTVSDIVRALEDALKAVAEAGSSIVAPALVPVQAPAAVAETLTQPPTVNVDVRVYLDERELKGLVKQVIMEVLTR
jgi:phage-related protein